MYFNTWPQTQQTTAALMCWQNKNKFFCAQCSNCLFPSADSIPVFPHQGGNLPHLLQSYSRDELKEINQILGFGRVYLDIGLAGRWKHKQKVTKTTGFYLTTKSPSFQPNSEGSRKWRYNKAYNFSCNETCCIFSGHHNYRSMSPLSHLYLFLEDLKCCKSMWWSGNTASVENLRRFVKGDTKDHFNATMLTSIKQNCTFY